MGVIYKATNLIDGMAFIGYTDDWDKLDQHYFNGSYKANSPFLKALKEYGYYGFYFEILYYDVSSHKLPLIINEHNTINEGYNTRPTPKPKRAHKPHSIPHTPEAKERISKALRGRPKSQKHRQAISEGHAVYKDSGTFYDDPSYKEKISKANKGKKRSQAFKDRVRELAYERWYPKRQESYYD